MAAEKFHLKGESNVAEREREERQLPQHFSDFS
jgi:hypothetical protein